jgi:hypothetical protein
MVRLALAPELFVPGWVHGGISGAGEGHPSRVGREGGSESRLQDATGLGRKP